MTEKLRVATLTEERLPAVLAFLARSYPDNPNKADPAYFRWRFFDHPLAAARDMYLLALQGDRVVGQWAAMPERLFVPALDGFRDAVWMVDLFVDPERRDQPIAVELFRTAMRAAVAAGRTLLTVGAHDGVTPFYRALRWQSASLVDTFYSVNQPAGLLAVAGRGASGLKKRALDVAGLALPIAQRLEATARPGGVAVEARADLSGDDVEAFHRSATRTLGITGDRSPALLRWKLVDRPVGEGFALVARARDGGVRGTMAVKFKRRGDTLWAEVVDFVTALDDEDALRSLLAAARKRTVDRGAAFLRVRASRSEHTRALTRPTWIRHARGAVDDVHLFGPAADMRALARGAWHLTALAADLVDGGNDELPLARAPSASTHA